MRFFSPSGQKYNHWSWREDATVPWTTKLWRCTLTPHLFWLPSQTIRFGRCPKIAAPCEIIHWAKFYLARRHHEYHTNGKLEDAQPGPLLSVCCCKLKSHCSAVAPATDADRWTMSWPLGLSRIQTDNNVESQWETCDSFFCCFFFC